MPDTIQDPIQKAIDEAKSGNKPEAKRLLAQVVKQEPENARAWYLLSQVSDNPYDAIFCLEQVIKIDPDNQQAKERLEHQKSAQTPALEPAPKKKKNTCVIIGLVLAGILAACVTCTGGLAGLGMILPTLTPTALVQNAAVELPGSPLPATATSQPLPTYTTNPTPTIDIVTDTPIPSITPIVLAPQSPGGGNAPACISPGAPTQIARVIEVVDGGTIKVSIDGQSYTVRYVGMNTAETVNPEAALELLGPEASAKNKELVDGKIVTLVKDVSETDPDGRLLRYVFVPDFNGTFVNYELVKLGYVSVASFPPDVACIPYFQQAEQSARMAGNGLWGATPIPSITPIIRHAPPQPGSAVCECSRDTYDCKNFNTHVEAQACYNYCVAQGMGDVHDIDGNDRDGVACESLP